MTSGNNTCTVLVVDDETVNIKALSNLLKGEMKVLFATGGGEALSLAQSGKPDLILLDIVMPGMDGHEVCRRLKADPKTRDIPVIFITSLSDDKDEAAGLELGAIDYISKPFHPAIVRMRVKNHLQLKLQRDTLERLAAELAIEVKQLVNAEREISHLATHDCLTGLPNRTLFMDRLGASINNAKRSGTEVFVMFVDLDGFKAVNDNLGHLYGDALLKGIAARLIDCVREVDTVARFGGDEFVVLLTNTDDAKAIEKIAEKMLGAMAEPFEFDGETAAVSGSIGIACYPGNGEDMETVLSCADTAMYEAKQKGKNAFFFSKG